MAQNDIICLFIYDLFIDAGNILQYTASSGRWSMKDELERIRREAAVD